MTTFALVHGAWHGAWCWERLVPEIEGHGHAAIAVDLPCDDVEAGCAAYAEVVLAQIAQADDDLVLVGHSLGGLTIPLVAAARPARKLVFLCALLPRPAWPCRSGRTGAGIFVPGTAPAPSATIRIARSGRMRTRRPTRSTAGARVSSRPGRLARLRPQARMPRIEPCPLAEWPAVESVSLSRATMRSSTRRGRAGRARPPGREHRRAARRPLAVPRPPGRAGRGAPLREPLSLARVSRRASGSARPGPPGPCPPGARGAPGFGEREALLVEAEPAAPHVLDDLVRAAGAGAQRALVLVEAHGVVHRDLERARRGALDHAAVAGVDERGRERLDPRERLEVAAERIGLVVLPAARRWA